MSSEQQEPKSNGHDTPRAEALGALGGLIHHAIERYIQHLIATQQEGARTAVGQVWDALQASGFEGEAVSPAYWAEARRVLERFAGQFRLDLEAVWKPEAQLALDWDGNPVDWWDEAAMVRGVADLVLVRGWQGEVLDWKSSRVPISEQELQEDLQARTYAMLALHQPQARGDHRHLPLRPLGRAPLRPVLPP